jgi:hypothetical protein
MDIQDDDDGLGDPRETSPAANAGGYFGRDYLVALQTHYRELAGGTGQAAVDKVLHVGVIGEWMRNIDRLGVDAPDRLRRLADRPWTSAPPGGPEAPHVGAARVVGARVLPPGAAEHLGDPHPVVRCDRPPAVAGLAGQDATRFRERRAPTTRQAAKAWPI